MNILVQAVCIVTAGILFCGCTTHQPVPEPAPVSEPEPAVTNVSPAMGTVTLIRSEAEPTAPSVQVIVSNEIVAVIDNFSAETFELPAGVVHLLTFNWPDTPITFDDEIAVELEKGDHKYISVLHRIEVPEYVRKEDSTDYTMVETLAAFELPAKFAQGVIKNLDAARAANDGFGWESSE